MYLRLCFWGARVELFLHSPVVTTGTAPMMILERCEVIMTTTLVREEQRMIWATLIVVEELTQELDVLGGGDRRGWRLG